MEEIKVIMRRDETWACVSMNQRQDNVKGGEGCRGMVRVLSFPVITQSLNPFNPQALTVHP